MTHYIVEDIYGKIEIQDNIETVKELKLKILSYRNGYFYKNLKLFNNNILLEDHIIIRYLKHKKFKLCITPITCNQHL